MLEWGGVEERGVLGLFWVLLLSVGVALDVVLAGGRLKLLSKMCCCRLLVM